MSDIPVSSGIPILHVLVPAIDLHWRAEIPWTTSTFGCANSTKKKTPKSNVGYHWPRLDKVLKRPSCVKAIRRPRMCFLILFYGLHLVFLVFTNFARESQVDLKITFPSTEDQKSWKVLVTSGPDTAHRNRLALWQSFLPVPYSCFASFSLTFSSFVSFFFATLSTPSIVKCFSWSFLSFYSFWSFALPALAILAAFGILQIFSFGRNPLRTPIWSPISPVSPIIVSLHNFHLAWHNHTISKNISDKQPLLTFKGRRVGRFGSRASSSHFGCAPASRCFNSFGGFVGLFCPYPLPCSAVRTLVAYTDLHFIYMAQPLYAQSTRHPKSGKAGDHETCG